MLLLLLERSYTVEMKILKLLNYLMDVWIILALIQSSCVSFFK